VRWSQIEIMVSTELGGPVHFDTTVRLLDCSKMKGLVGNLFPKVAKEKEAYAAG
jgi:hypothetical protein